MVLSLAIMDILTIYIWWYARNFLLLPYESVVDIPSFDMTTFEDFLVVNLVLVSIGNRICRETSPIFRFVCYANRMFLAFVHG